MADVRQEDMGLPKELPDDPGMSYDPVRSVARRDPMALHREVTIMYKTGILSQWRVDEPASRDLAEQETGPPPSDEFGLPMPIAFTLQRIVGTGGFGEVWEATQQSLGRTIAVKRLKDSIYQRAADTWQSRQLEVLFRQEALTAASLEHPNIVPVHDLGLDESGRPLLAMKMVKGKPWHQMIREDFELSTGEFLGRHLQILIDVAQAVAFAHSRGVVHRDLKPSQVMVGEFGEVLLMDWGLALVYDKDKARQGDTNLLTTGLAPTKENAQNPAGTPCYMAPEQTEETMDRIGPWTDVFLLGGILYFLLTRSVPYPGGKTFETYKQAMVGDVEPPRYRAPGRWIPAELNAVCTKAMAPEPEDRYQSATEFMEGIQDYLSGAGKRRESMALTSEVAGHAKGDGTSGYQVLTGCMEKLERAAGLWPENPDIPPLRRWVLTELAQTAAANNDLALARAMIERLEEGLRRETLLEQVAKREQSIRDVRRQRWIFLGLTIVLLAAVYGLVFGFFMLTRETHQATERGEDLMNYIFARANGLPPEQITPEELNNALSQVMAFYDKGSIANLHESTLQQRGRDLDALADRLIDAGQLPSALMAQQVRLNFLEALDAPVTMSQCLVEIARLQMLLGLTDQGRMTFRQGMNLSASQGTEAQRTIREAYLREDFADSLNQSGLYQEGIDVITPAYDFWRQRVDKDDTDENRISLAEIMVKKARMHNALGQTKSAKTVYSGAYRILSPMKVRMSRPASFERYFVEACVGSSRNSEAAKFVDDAVRSVEPDDPLIAILRAQHLLPPSWGR
ncbi:serine/threonine protein kinase [bacterium]|nr:serine/threonine protein kinase [bacterium]